MWRWYGFGGSNGGAKRKLVSHFLAPNHPESIIHVCDVSKPIRIQQRIGLFMIKSFWQISFLIRTRGKTKVISHTPSVENIILSYSIFTGNKFVHQFIYK
jgi:hypothetical protein